MPYPVRLVGGTDRVQVRPPSGRFYAIGERIDDLDDDTRAHLQANGVRFEAIHDDTPALPSERPAPPPALPADQAALNDRIAAETPKADVKTARRGGTD